MKEVLNTIFDHVFSFGMFMFLLLAGFGFLLYATFTAEYERSQRTQLRTDACYAQGMVLVRSDAGERCVLPQSLVKVK